jgi:ATP-binding cassette subfamily B multidrug efflux pump
LKNPIPVQKRPDFFIPALIILRSRTRFGTVIGERGVTLSGGQRQRTSISRAVARHPEILILDDVLSAVDTQTEAAIMAKLLKMVTDTTN